MAVALPASHEASTPHRSQPLRAVDWLLLGYLSIVSVVALARAPEQPDCWWLLLAHGLFVVFLALLTRVRLGPVGQALREVYPLFLLAGLYSELDVLNGAADLRIYDALVQRWELALFGSQISQEWYRTAPSRFLSFLFHGAYFSYYFIVSLPAFYFLWRRDFPAARHFVLVVMTTFVLCYLVFIFFPVAGPSYVFPPPPDWLLDNPAARLVYQTLATGSSYGTAFPSSHVAATVAAAIAATRGSRRLGLTLLTPTILLLLVVVYCQMHYGVDAMAGVMVGGAVGVGTRTQKWKVTKVASDK
ncbi:MAG: phosphatase PAP2 family protein [Gemmatimonadales bacterium]